MLTSTQKKLMIIGIISFLFVLIVIVFFLIIDKYSPNINAHKGVIEFEAEDIINLNGEWYFFWDELIQYEAITSGQVDLNKTVNVPACWDTYDIDGKPLSGNGYGTYVAKISTKGQKTFALKILTLSSAYEIAIDDKIIAKNGTIGTNKDEVQSAFEPQTVVFNTDKDTFHLIVRISNFSYARGGMWSSLYLGTPDKITEFNTIILKKDFLLLGALLSLMLYFFIIFLQRKQERGYLLLSITSATSLLIHFTAKDTLIYNVLWFLDYRETVVFNYLSFYWTPILYLAIIHDFFPKELHRNVLKIHIVVVFFLSVFVLLTPTSTFTYSGKYYDVVILFTFVIGNLSTILALIKKRKYASSIFTGYLIVTLAGIYDTLVSSVYIDSRFGYTSVIGNLVFAFFVAYILGKRYSHTHNALKTLTTELIKKDAIKQEFIENISHNIKLPLNTIETLSYNLIMEDEHLNTTVKKHSIEKINYVATYINDLIKDLLNMVLLKNDDIQLSFVSIDIYKMLTLTIDIMNTQIKESKDAHNLILLKNADDVGNILGDVNYLQDIFKTLLFDIRKYSITSSTLFQLDKKEEHVHITIDYNNLFVPREWLNLLSKANTPIHAYIDRPYGNIILKIDKIQNIINKCEGIFNIEIIEGKGTRIDITLPKTEKIAFEDYEVTKKIVDYEKEVVSQEGNSTLLVADTNVVHLHVITSFLDGEHYTVLGAKTEEEALVLLQNRQIDLIIVDYLFSQSGGLMFVQSIRQLYDPKELPILMLVPSSFPELFSNSHKAGVNDFLVKPLEGYELRARVKTLLDYGDTIQKLIESNMAFLRAQIKPHFIYNTLTAIIALEDKASKKLLINFSKFLRNSFEFTDTSKMINIKKELTYIEAYIEIEKIRFSHKLTVTYDIDDSLNFMIPLLILQPLLENGIKHGIMPKREGGNVGICIKTKEQDIIITISDTGVGMTPEKIEDILQNPKSENIGVSNIHKRLTKLYGKGLEITSQLTIGTIIKIVLPQKK